MHSSPFQSLFGNSVSLFAIRVVIILASLWGMVYYARELDKATYQIYQFLIISLSVCIAIGSLGIGSVIYNFSPGGFNRFIHSLKRPTLVYFLGWILLLSIIFSWIIRTQTGKMFETGIPVLLLLCLFSIISFILENILLIYPARKVLFPTNLVYAILWLAAHYLSLDHHSLDLNQFIWTWIIISALKSFLLFIILRAQSKKPPHPLADMSEIQADRRTWMQLGFYEVFQLVVKQVDKMLIPFLTSAEAAANYFNGRFDIPVLPVILSSVRNAALIQLGRSGSGAQVVKTIRQTFELLSSIGLAVVIFGIVYSTELITVIFTDKYAASIPIFICTLLILPAQFCISLAYVLQFRDKANLINRGAFIDLGLTLILLYPFFHLWGNMGIILSVVVSTYVQSLYYLVHASRALRARILSLIPWGSYIRKVIIFGLIAIGCHYFGDWIFAPSFNLILGAIVGGFVVWYSFRRYRKDEVHPFST